MSETIISNVGPAKIDIAYDRIGDTNAPPVVLIQGLAAQMVQWPDGFCAALVERGLQLILFDNRDSGRSTRVSNAPPPDLPAALRGDFSSASYTLSDMAADTVGLLDALGIESAHFVGASMGGAISQMIAIEHPKRVRSLTLMMTTTGDRKVGQVAPHAMKALFGGGPAVTRQDVIDRQVQAISVVGSPGYPVDPAEVAERTGRAYDRGYDPAAIARQAVASVAAGDRTERLRGIHVPTVVIHGLDDAMCDVSGGRAVAGAIPGAKLVLMEGMGHNLPPGAWPEITAHIADIVRAGEAAR